MSPAAIVSRTSASSLVPLWSRAAEWERRLAMIREARSFLYLSTFYIEYDAYGAPLLAALVDAQRRRVAVNLLIDGFGQLLGGVLMSAEAKAALASRLSELQGAGAVVAVYRPARYLQRRLGGGQHVKIQVSDAGEAIFGSSNLTKSSFEGWNEYSVSLRGPVARTLLESYRQIGGSVEEDHLHQLADVEGPVADLALDYWLCNPNLLQGALGPLGWRGPNVVTDRLIERIESAQASIAITSFYFKPVEPLLAALLRAAGRGVAVEVHHSHRDALPATDLAWIAAAASYERLLGAGVRVYENRHGEHSKIVLIDGAWAAFGSYNFEDAAHDRLAEAMLASGDARAVAPAAAIFEELRRDPDNAPVTAQSLRDLPARLLARRALFGRFKRWM
jgi:cardiolipin synthase A/B